MSFHPPRKDTCKPCDVLKVLLESATGDVEKNRLKLEKVIYLRKAEKVRKSSASEKEKCAGDESYQAITFDLEKP